MDQKEKTEICTRVEKKRGFVVEKEGDMFIRLAVQWHFEGDKEMYKHDRQ